MKSFICMLLGIVSAISFAQEGLKIRSDEGNSILLNLDNKSLSASLPFDQTFSINVISKDYKLASSSLIMMVKMSDDSRQRDYVNIRTEEIIGDFSYAKPIAVKHIKDSLYRVIVPPLKPNKTYEFFFRSKLSPKELKIIRQVIFKEIAGYDYTAKALYKSEITDLEKKYILGNQSIHTGNFMVTYNDLKILICTIVNPEIEDFKDAYSSYCNMGTVRSRAQIAQIAGLLNIAVKGNKLNEVSESLSDINLLKKMYGGLSNVENTAKIEAHDLEKRISTIDSSKKKLQLLLNDVRKTNLVSPNAILSDFENELTAHIHALASIKKEIGTLNTFISKTILSDNDFDFSRPFSAETTEKTLTAQSGRTLVPDFGLINVLAFNNAGDYKYIGRPYVGLNIHFGGGIDKDIRLRELRAIKQRWFVNHFSLAVGVTLGKINEGNFSDLFNGITPSIGMNYRLAKRIRVGTGVSFLREKDPNPIFDKNPVELAPYASITFDLDLFNELGKFSSTIFN